MKHAADAMKEARVHDFLASVDFEILLTKYLTGVVIVKGLIILLVLVLQVNALQYRRMDFEEFCAAALSVHQLEALDRWEQHARCAYEIFEKEGNRAIMIEELASVIMLFIFCSEYLLPRLSLLYNGLVFGRAECASNWDGI